MGKLKPSSSDIFGNVRSKRMQYYLDGTNNLGAAKATELEWKDYCPEAFRIIQEQDGVDQANYSMLHCASDILKEVVTPTKPGRTFFVSSDTRLMVRTLRKFELKAMLETFPSYYFYITQNPKSLFIKLYGLHSVKQIGGIKVYFVVFENTIQPEVNIADCYHLKGISTGRRNRKYTKVEDVILLKDVDFGYRFYLNPTMREKLLEQITSDCAYLEAEGRMDYGLALVVAMPSEDSNGSGTNNQTRSHTSSSSSISDDVDCGSTQSSDSEIVEDIDSTKFRFSRGLSARAVRKRVPSSKTGNSNGDQEEEQLHYVEIYVEIMEIFQKYNVKKRIEHIYKKIQHETKSVSTVKPKDYCTRFLEFTQQIFLPENS
ncbi:Phosphatidylinositol 4-phosphate 5-kinase 10 [Euphorbia peplus]|nr:Phosphatidylinositol 4-phosphate 5-kinase 10 [Euphorbia peplus]